MSTAKYTPSQTAALREELLRAKAEPLVLRTFDRHPRLQSAMMLVAQFWNDEADDAVHYEFIYSERETPDVGAASQAEDAEDETWDDVNFPSPMDEEAWYELRRANLYDGDSNGDAICLFAAFTRENCHQNMALAEAYEPYAIFRRTPQGLTTEVVGKMLRPWLDGVRPTWERSP